MGTKEKTKQFMEASETYQLYSGIIELALSYFIAKAEQEGNEKFVDDLKKARDEYKMDFERAVGIAEEVFSEIFSDEELDELIVIHSTPAFQKLRGQAPTIMNKFFEKYSLASGQH